jgi:hypothetical protein
MASHWPSFESRLSSLCSSPQPGSARGEGLLVSPRDDEDRARHAEVLARATGLREAALDRRKRDLLHVATRREGVGDQAVRGLAGHLRHQRPDAREVHAGRPVLELGGREHGRHQGVGVELAAELERLALVPAIPDGAHREDELAHARGRLAPGHAEALGDVGTDLGAEAQDEAPLRVGVQVVPGLSQRHRVAGEGHGDRGHELDPLGVLRGDGHRQERIVGDLRRDGTVVAELLELSRAGGHLGEVRNQTRVDLHGGLRR